jgi:hypothetical protein
MGIAPSDIFAVLYTFKDVCKCFLVSTELAYHLLKGTSKNAIFVTPAKAGVQLNQQAGFPPSRE